MEVEIYKMIYKRSNNIKELKILGENFVKHNKNKGNIIINNKKEKLKNIKLNKHRNEQRTDHICEA